MQYTNTASSLGFEVIHTADQPTDGQLAYALATRLADLFGDDRSEMANACWDPFDSYVEAADDLYANGIDPTPALSEWEIRTLARTIRQITNRRAARRAS